MIAARPALGRRAVLQLAFQQICRERAGLILGVAALCAQSNEASDAGEFGKASTLALSANAKRVQIAPLTEQIDAIQAELDELDRARLLEQHAAVDETAGLVAA